jgi:hypothetical protein
MQGCFRQRFPTWRFRAVHLEPRGTVRCGPAGPVTVLQRDWRPRESSALDRSGRFRYIWEHGEQDDRDSDTHDKGRQAELER